MILSKLTTFFNKVKTLIPFAVNLYLILLGLGWVFIHIYFRAIIERKPYPLNDIKYNLSSKHVILFTLFIILHLVLICISLFTLYKQNREATKVRLPKVFILFLEKVNYCFDLLYWRPLQFLHDTIAPHLPFSLLFFLYLDKRWTKKRRGKNYFYGIIFLFDSLPKIIISISFFVDIVVYAQMKYFFYFIPLILVPISFSIFLKLMESCGVRGIPLIQVYFSRITGHDPVFDEKGEIIAYRRYEYWVKPEYAPVIDPSEEMDLLLQLHSMQIYALDMKDFKNNINTYLTIITSTIYLISGIVRCYIIFL